MQSHQIMHLKSLLIKTRHFCVALLVLVSTSYAHAIETQFFYDSKEEEQVRSDLSFLFSIKSTMSSDLHLEVFGGTNGAAYQTFLESRIKVIRRSNSGASVFAFSVDGYRDAIAVTSKFFELPQILRVAVLMHEARHSESAHTFWKHIACPSPYLDEDGKEMKSAMDNDASLSGQVQACDADSKGSYGISALLLKNIAENCENCDSDLKNQAKALYLDIRKRISDPIERQKL